MGPIAIAFTPDGKTAYIANFDVDSITAIDTAANTATATIPIGPAGDGPRAIAIAPLPSNASITGKQKKDKFLTQTERFNVIRWNASETALIVFYNIYRDQAHTDRIASVLASEELKFVDHNRKKGVTYTYFITQVNIFGIETSFGSVTVQP